MKSVQVLTLLLFARLSVAKLTSSYKLVDGTGERKFVLEKDDKFLECDKDCIAEYDDDDCDRCTVHANNNHVYCRKGQVAQTCRQTCCRKVTAGGHTVSNQVAHDESLATDEYELVKDLSPHDDSNHLTIMPFDDGKTTVCKKSCIEENMTRKCSQCILNINNDVLCKGASVPLSCRKVCCDEEFDDFMEVADYAPNNKNSLLTYHEEEFYLCMPHCIADQSEKKCDLCRVEKDLAVKCNEGRVHQGCRRECCELVKN
mmetsp:Transcript_15713/g.33024  ORF Transcript_15713/g.33024 Transcript_15713/m.33024 type:complete len:258 (+) Transcript_15713:163-936(+)